jgi:hypothetical protein
MMKCPQVINSLVLLQFVIVSLASNSNRNDEKIENRSKLLNLMDFWTNFATWKKIILKYNFFFVLFWLLLLCYSWILTNLKATHVYLKFRSIGFSDMSQMRFNNNFFSIFTLLFCFWTSLVSMIVKHIVTYMLITETSKKCLKISIWNVRKRWELDARKSDFEKSHWSGPHEERSMSWHVEKVKVKSALKLFLTLKHRTLPNSKKRTEK